MNFLGIGSGLDLSTMLEGLVKVASEPKVQQLGRREIQLQDSISGLGLLKSKMSEFQDAADALKDGAVFTKMTPTLTQPSSGDLIKVEAGDSAVASNYDIEVVSLAQGSRAMSDWRSVKYQSDVFADTSVGLGMEGTLNFGGTKTITISSTDSVKEIAKKINGEGGYDGLAGITAKVVDGRLEYTADGTDETLSVTAAGTDAAGLSVFATVDQGGNMSIRADSAKTVGLSGDLTFGADGKSFSVTLDGNESLDAIVAKINSAEENFGVTANVIDGQLVYQSNVTGKDNDLSVTGDAGLEKLTTSATNMVIAEADKAANAQINVDGIAIENDTNTFDAAISGLTITALKQSQDGDTATLSIGSNSSEVQKKIETFMSTYNALRTTMNELKGTTDEDGNYIAGKLSNDPIVRNVESVLNGVITAVAQEADEDRNTLFSIGIEITEDGTLSKSNSDTKAGERWDAAMSGSMEKLKKLFAGDADDLGSKEGIADLASTALEGFTGFTGVIKGKEDSIQQQLDGLEEQYEAHARYIESYEKTLKMQFTALDSTIGKMNSIMQYIGPQLAALPGVSK